MQTAIPFWLQIRWNLILYSVLLAVVPLALVSAFTVSRHTRQDNEQVFNQLESVAELKTDQIERWIKENQDVVNLIMSDAALYQTLADAEVEDQELNARLAHLADAHPAITEMFLYTPDGDVIASSIPANAGKIVNRQPYFQSSLQGEAIYQVFPPFYALGTQELVLYSTYQLRDSADQVIRVVAFGLDLSRLGEIMSERTGLPQTGETYLVSRQNNYLLTPSNFPGYILTRAYHSEGIDAALTGQRGAGTYTGYRNTSVMGVYHWIPELEAGLMAEVEQSEALAEATQTRNTTLGAAATAILIAAVFGLFYAAYVSRPIVALTRAASAIAGGDYNQTIHATSRNEIGQLTRAFNSMTTQLRRTITDLKDLNDHLEARVAARTRDLTIAAQVSQQVTKVLDLKILLPDLVEFTRSGFDLYHVSVFLFNEDKDVLQLAAATGEAGRQMLSQGKHFGLQDIRGLVPLAARERRPIIINNVAQSREHMINPGLPHTAAEVALPMVVGQHLIGVLDLQSTRIDRFQAEDIKTLTTLADQIAIAVRNAQLFADAELGRQTAEQANQIKSQFLANMSHELRTPLNAILNFTAFVADEVMGPVNEEQAEALNEAIASGKHLLALINDVLDITKIEAGMMELFIQEVDLNEVLKATESVAKGLLKDKPVELIAEIPDHLPRTYGDKRRLRQVFLNLMSNAAKFTAHGSITLRAWMDNQNLHVSISDTGIGIAPADQGMVFESFKQAKHDLPETVGTGLGMPITRFFVESHGGTIWFESTLDVGTTFHVLLPIQTEAEAA